MVITDKALFDFANDEHEMQLISLLPGIMLEHVRSKMGWEVTCAPNLIETAPPTVDELRLLRVELDPDGMYKG